MNNKDYKGDRAAESPVQIGTYKQEVERVLKEQCTILIPNGTSTRFGASYPLSGLEIVYDVNRKVVYIGRDGKELSSAECLRIFRQEKMY